MLSRNARARNTHVEENLNQHFPAQATGARFLRFTVEAGAPAASVAAADQMERGGAGVDPPGLKPLETTSTPVV